MNVPDIPEPTSYGLTKFYYNDSNDILEKVLSIFSKKIDKSKKSLDHHDVPGSWFKGPF
jgi:pyruvate dehydrogenase E1 component beta subunit